MQILPSECWDLQLAAFVVRMTYEDLSEEARQQLKIRILDALGCAIGAIEGPPIKMLRTQLDLAARIATAAGYTVTQEGRSLRIVCPASFAEELNRCAREAGAARIVIRAKEASLEERFLSMLKGEY